MDNPVHVHVPYPLLGTNLQTILDRRLNPEVFFTAADLDRFVAEELVAMADCLSSAGISTTIHAPFMDLNPGAIDPLVRNASLHRFNQVLDAADILRPRVMVLHPGYDRLRYGEQQDIWLNNSMETFTRVLPRFEAIGCILAVENIFEEEPSTLKALLEVVDRPLFRHCFDVGHWNLFHRVSMEEWFSALGCYVAEVHIHDNRGERDDHCAIGGGNIDFPLFFRLMEEYAPTAVYTIEAHCRAEIDLALQRLAPHLKFSHGTVSVGP